MFYDQLENELDVLENMTQTTNGAPAYKSSGKSLLDFNFEITPMRSATKEVIQENFAEVYKESPRIAIKYLFYVRDVRGGLGERHIFRSCFEWLVENDYDNAVKLLWLIPTYGRWDDLINLIDIPAIKDNVIQIIHNQMKLDCVSIRTKSKCSLMAKWLPSENATSKETKRKAKEIIRGLGISPRKYRKFLSTARKCMDVVERKMCAKEWENIRYDAVPSRANLIYKDAFLRNDEDRRRAYLDSLSKGETKINAGVLQPPEIISKYSDSSYWSMKVNPVDDALESLWKNLKDVQIGNTVVIRDGSGSMMSRVGNGNMSCLDVSTALAIYCAEHNTGEWKDRFITFSSKPRIVDLRPYINLHDKLKRSYEEAECSNTNIYKTMGLILKTGIKNNLTQEEMPERIIIISDMQFDNSYYSYGFNWDDSLFDEVAENYQRCGYKLPKICFWNVAGTINKTIPMKENDCGLVLCSGYSTEILKMVMSGKTDPYEVLLEQINSPRYDDIDTALGYDIVGATVNIVPM